MGALFFTLVLFAALTSSVSVMEAIVSMMMDRFGLSRIKCCIGIVLFSILLGVPCSLGNGIWSGFTIFGMDFLTFCDFISNSILLPVVAFNLHYELAGLSAPITLLQKLPKTAKPSSAKIFTA